MDDAIRDHIQRHADAVVCGGMGAVAADFSDELRPQVPQIAETLGPPVTSTEVLSVEPDDLETVATIRYASDSDSVTIRSHWSDQGGRPVIVRAEPAGWPRRH